MTFFETRNKVNLDITFRCPLECSKCSRQSYYAKNNKPVEGQDMSLNSFMKIVNHFKELSFCGQISDPVNHPQFIKFLKISFEFKKNVSVHTANSHKTLKWYEQAFKANVNAKCLHTALPSPLYFINNIFQGTQKPVSDNISQQQINTRDLYNNILIG